VVKWEKLFFLRPKVEKEPSFDLLYKIENSDYGFRGSELFASDGNGTDTRAPIINPDSVNFNASRKELLEAEMELALKYNNFTLLGGQCTSLNYKRFNETKPQVHQKWVDSIRSFDRLRVVNMILTIVVSHRVEVHKCIKGQFMIFSFFPFV
jgi:hypothetical protein